MRNDNNTVIVKTERTSSKQGSCDSFKENELPDEHKRITIDQGIQPSSELEEISTRNSKRSNSVELVVAKSVEIDITSDCDAEKMPPPPPRKDVKKTRTKQKKQTEDSVIQQPSGLRITRSKIKQEKVSINPSAHEFGSSLNGSQNDSKTLPASKKGKKVSIVMREEKKLQFSFFYLEDTNADSRQNRSNR